MRPQPHPDQRFGHPRDGLLPREGYPPPREAVPLQRDGRPLSREAAVARDSRPQSREAMGSMPRPQSRETPTGLPRDRSFAQHISSEIERQMTADRAPDSRPFLPQPPSSTSQPPPVSSVPNMSSQNIMNMTVERAIQNSHVQSSVVSRMSRVIEDSVRKDPVVEKKSIYAPNSRGRPEAGEAVMEGLSMPRGTASPGDRQKPSTSLPQVEGLAARFSNFQQLLEKEEKAGGRVQPPSAPGSAEGLAARFSSPDPASAAGLSRPNSTSSKSSLTQGNQEAAAQPQEPEQARKRPGSPVASPVPGKKAASSSGDGSAPDDSSRYMQEINMGFDRLVAMASEVDKRRKSAENSPQQAGQHGSPRKTGASDLRLTDASFDPNSLAAKFKAGLMQGQGGPSQDKPNPSGPTLHGGNLPEHHFKKRYFNEEYQRQQQKETQETRDMDRAREVAREHRERDAAHAQREHRERQMAEQARRQSEYERSVAQGGGHRPPGPGYPGQGYEDQRGQRPGPGYSGPPPRHPPPEHFRHNGPPPGGSYPPRGYPANPAMMQMMYRQRMIYNRGPPPLGSGQPHPRPPPPP